MLDVALCCLYSDFAYKILLALILLGESKGSKTLDLKKVEKFFQKIYNP